MTLKVGQIQPYKEYSQKAEIKATSVDKIRGNTSEREVHPDNDNTKKNRGMSM